jgi:hypothetical protein
MARDVLYLSMCILVYPVFGQIAQMAGALCPRYNGTLPRQTLRGHPWSGRFSCMSIPALIISACVPTIPAFVDSGTPRLELDPRIAAIVVPLAPMSRDAKPEPLVWRNLHPLTIPHVEQAQNNQNRPPATPTVLLKWSRSRADRGRQTTTKVTAERKANLH